MIKTGLDILIGDRLDEIAGLRLGVTANHASVTGDGVHICDALVGVGLEIAALFGPEHGIRGDILAGEDIGDDIHERLRVPVYSLYGKAKSPTPEMLEGIDAMIVDLQDIGARFWTFESTMANVMTSCGQCGVPVYVLDRPNPISGLRADGPVLAPRFSSFVGMFSIPIRHALTMGELATLYRTRFGIECDLIVIEMEGWRRAMWFDDTGLSWVAPSPNMPTLDAATVYPGMCLLEGTNVSEGRGTPRPFETFGAPWIDPALLMDMLLGYGLPGVGFEQARFTPSASKFQGIECSGLRIHVTGRVEFRPVLTGVAIVGALHRLYPDEFAFRPPTAGGRCFFDLLAGTDRLRESIQSGADTWDIAETWVEDIAVFQDTARGIRFY